MKINLSKNSIDKTLLSKVQKAFDYAIEFLKIDCKDLEVNIAFVGKIKIKKINRDFRNIDRVTDIISFPFLLQPGVEGMQLIEGNLTKNKYMLFVNPETNNVVLGDLYICFPKMKEQAKEYGTGIEREFVYLCVHGLLHLLGYDHMVEDDKKVMREKEELILKNVFENMK